MDNKFKFNRTLSDDEVQFWNDFLTKLPVVSNSYISGLYEVYEMYPKMAELRNTKALEHINGSLDLATKEDLVEFFKKDPDTPHCRQKFEKAITIYSERFPHFSPFQLMFLTIYCSTLKDMNLKVEHDGVKLIPPNNEDCLEVTFCPQLAILGDLMNGRMKDLDTKFPYEPVTFEGNVLLKQTPNDTHTINVSLGLPTNYGHTNKPSVLATKEKNYLTEYSIDVAGSNTNNYDIISPLGNFQKDFNGLLNMYNLKQSLSTEDKKTKKAKI